MLDGSGKPQSSYRDFVDQTKSKFVLATRMRSAFDDLFVADQEAHGRNAEQLKGWFKTKTGAGDAVAKKMATTFKSLASYADFSKLPKAEPEPVSPPQAPATAATKPAMELPLGLTYRIEVHLPDTTNLDTFRAIFRALREELVP